MKADGWAIETMKITNVLTPGIKGKAFDPGWFMLRQRLEQAEQQMKRTDIWPEQNQSGPAAENQKQNQSDEVGHNEEGE